MPRLAISEASQDRASLEVERAFRRADHLLDLALAEPLDRPLAIELADRIDEVANAATEGEHPVCAPK